eukprot:COSAG01_NODE_5258_length_4379_cov_23.575467_2_plen_137_part_00
MARDWPTPKSVEVIRHESRVVVLIPERAYAPPHDDSIVTSLLEGRCYVRVLRKVVEVRAIEHFLRAHVCSTRATPRRISRQDCVQPAQAPAPGPLREGVYEHSQCHQVDRYILAVGLQRARTRCMCAILALKYRSA